MNDETASDLRCSADSRYGAVHLGKAPRPKPPPPCGANIPNTGDAMMPTHLELAVKARDKKQIDKLLAKVKSIAGDISLYDQKLAMPLLDAIQTIRDRQAGKE
jgi:hypothetical protein